MGHRFDPWSRKIPHALEHLIPHTTLLKTTRNPTGACTPEPGLPRRKPPQWEICALHLESNSCSPQLEKAHTKQQRPSAAKNKSVKLKVKYHWKNWEVDSDSCFQARKQCGIKLLGITVPKRSCCFCSHGHYCDLGQMASLPRVVIASSLKHNLAFITLKELWR